MPMPMSSQIKAGREGVGLFENALSMLTSAAGEPAAGMVALAELIRGGDSGAARDAVRQAFAYQPRTDAGQRQQRMLGELAASAMNSAPVTTWQRGVDIAGRYSPAAGAALQTIPTAIGAVYGAKPAMQQGRAASMLAERMQEGMVKNAMAPRKLHPQSGVFDIWGILLDADNNGGRTAAKQKAQEMIAKNPEMENDIISNYIDLGYSDLKAQNPEAIIQFKPLKNAAKQTGEIDDELDFIKGMIQKHYDESTSHQTYGYRIIPDDMDLSVGDYLPDSYRWDDGLRTEELLNGTSSLGIDIDDLESGIRQAQRLRKRYLGKKHAIIATKKGYEVGDDEGEYVLPDAKIIGFVKE